MALASTPMTKEKFIACLNAWDEQEKLLEQNLREKRFKEDAFRLCDRRAEFFVGDCGVDGFFNQVKEKELEKKRLRVGDKLSSFFWNQGALMEL